MKISTLLLLLALFLPKHDLLAQKKKPSRQVVKTKTIMPDSLDAETGLKKDANLMYVKAHCTGCHAAKLITQHRYNRDGWQDKIRWMQQYHKLWDLGDAEKKVLDYLEKHYAIALVNNNLRRQTELKEFIWYQLN